jgi:hypothetical protein
MRELLFRLLKKQEDGSYKVVGYEKHEVYNDFHNSYSVMQTTKEGIKQKEVKEG